MMPIIDFGSLHIPTFFLVISLSLSCLMFVLSERVQIFGKDRKIAFDLSLLLMLAGFLGGRLMHVFFEEWEYYSMDPRRIFEFWRGGFVYYGGLLFCFVAALIYCRVKKISFLEWADFFAPLFSLSHALGRIGCLLSGCCFGQYCELPWALDGRHPTVLYLFFGEIAILFVLLHYEQSNQPRKVGELFAKWILLHSVLRLNVEFFRDDFRGRFFDIPPFGYLSVSQVISLILMIGVGLFYVIQRNWGQAQDAKPLRPPPPPV